MDDFAESEIFDHVESFLIEMHSDNSANMSGSGTKYDIQQFRNIRKFITYMNDEYHTGMGVVDGNFGLKKFTPQKVEEIFHKATNIRMDYGDIVKSTKDFIFFLNELKYENINTFDDLSKRSKKFTNFLKKLKETDIGKRQLTLIDQIEEKFKPFYDSLEFYMQQSIGFDYKSRNYEDIDDFNEELADLSDQLREFRTLVKRIKVIKKQGLPQLISKYLEGIQNKHISQKKWNSLVKLISFFPLHISSNIWGPDEIKEFLVDTANFVLRSDKESEKNEFIEKIKILLQKILDKKMEGGATSRVVQDEMQKSYKKKMIIEVFRYNLQGYYSEIITKFNDLIKQKYIGQLNIVSSSLRSTVIDLKQIFTLLIDDNYIEEDLRDFIDIIRSNDEYQRVDRFNEGLRIKFSYIKQEVDNIIKDAKSSEYSKNRQFTDDFIQHIHAISVTIGHIVAYIKSLERKDFDLTDVEIKTFQSQIQKVNTSVISEELNKMMEDISIFISISHMYQNIERTKKELDTIDLKRYQDQSVKMFIDAKDDMQKYYKNLYEFFKKEDTVYNPTLALYMKEVLLKFHSCLYISKGISSHYILNPRYFTSSYDDTGENRLNPELPISLPTYNIWQRANDYKIQLVGITEELGATQFKGRARNIPEYMVFVNELYSDFLPTKPSTLRMLEEALGETNLPQRSKYHSQIKYPNIFDIVQTNEYMINLPVHDPYDRAPGHVTKEQFLLFNGFLNRTDNDDTFSQKLVYFGLGRLAGETPLQHINRRLDLVQRIGEDRVTYIARIQPFFPARRGAGLPGESPSQHIQRAKFVSTLERQVTHIPTPALPWGKLIYPFPEEIAGCPLIDFYYAVIQYVAGPRQGEAMVDFYNRLELDVILNYAPPGMAPLLLSQADFERYTYPIPVRNPYMDENATLYSSRIERAPVHYQRQNPILGGAPRDVATHSNDFIAAFTAGWNSLGYIQQYAQPQQIGMVGGFLNFVGARAAQANQILQYVIPQQRPPTANTANQLFPLNPQGDDDALAYLQNLHRHVFIKQREPNDVFAPRFTREAGRLQQTLKMKLIVSGMAAESTSITRIRRYKPEQVSRLLQTKFGVLSRSVELYGNNTPQFQYLLDIVNAFTPNTSIEDDNYYPGHTNALLYLNDVSLTEYLLPEIQVPFIQPFMKLFSLKDTTVNTNLPLQIIHHNPAIPQQLQIDVPLCEFTTNLDQIQYVRILNQQYDTPAIQYQYANVTQVADPNMRLVDYNNRLNWNDYNHDLTSILGVQCSVPTMYTPKGLFGFRQSSYEPDTMGRFINLKSYCDTRLLGLFPMVNIFDTHSHNLGISTMLDQPAATFEAFDCQAYHDQKQFSIFHPINTMAVCVDPCNPLLCNILRDQLNTSIEYQMYMSQQLQYFAMQGNITIFDPMVRKKIFNISHQVYTGQEIIPGLNPQILLIPMADMSSRTFVTIDDIDHSNLYFILARPFGFGSLKRNQVQIVQNDIIQSPTLAPFPTVWYQARQGSLKQIPGDFMNTQPKVPIPILLLKCTNNKYRNKLIDICSNKCPSMIENGVLRVTKNSIDILISILNSDVDGERMRCYISSCIQIQYHNNYQYMRYQDQISEAVELHNKLELEQGKLRFLDLVKKVINIKQVGNAALILLTDIVNTSINDQINQVANSKKIDYKTLLEELNNLIILYRQEPANTVINYFDGFMTQEDLTILTRNNHYLNNYIHNVTKPNSFYDGKYEILGGAPPTPPDHNPFEQYFQVLDRYIHGLKQVVQKMPILENFASLFSLIAAHEGTSKSPDADTIKRFISEYMIASMIDINESVLEFDFDVQLNPIDIAIADRRSDYHYPIVQSQLSVDVRDGKSLKLITPDCISVPIVMKASNPLRTNDAVDAVGAAGQPGYIPPAYDHRNINSAIQLVPQFTSRVTRDFDQLFNQLINAMSQRMVNHIGIYRFTQKKQLDETVQISRIMLGVGKNRKKNRKERSSLQYSEEQSGESLQVVDTKSEMSQTKFELYFRVYLLVKYYYGFFDEMANIIRNEYGNTSKYITYRFKPDSSEPEGRLFQMLDFLKPNRPFADPPADPRVSREYMSMEDLKQFMTVVDKIGTKHQLTTNDQFYSKIIQFVNLNFGLISNFDSDQLDNLNRIQREQPVTLKNFINGFDQYIQPVQVGDSRLNSLNKIVDLEKDQRNDTYTNVRFIIEKSIDRLSRLLVEFQNDVNNTQNRDSINKYIRNQYKLLKIKNADINEINNNLLYIINNIGQNKIDDIQIPLMFHEQFLFTAEIYNKVKLAIQIKDEMDDIDNHVMLGYIPPPAINGGLYDGYDNVEQLALVGSCLEGNALPTIFAAPYIPAGVGGAGNPQVFPVSQRLGHEVYEGKNKEVIINFINRLADQYSLFAGSNLVNFNINYQQLTVPADVSGNAVNNDRIYYQSYQQFKNAIIIEDSNTLTRKLDQLKAILSSIHSNSRFDRNRIELYKKQQEIVRSLDDTDIVDVIQRTNYTNLIGTINTGQAVLATPVQIQDGLNAQRQLNILKAEQSVQSTGRRKALIGMIGRGRLNLDDDAEIDDTIKELKQFSNGGIPMQNNIYYQYGNPSQINTIKPIVLPIINDAQSEIPLPSLKPPNSSKSDKVVQPVVAISRTEAQKIAERIKQILQTVVGFDLNTVQFINEYRPRSNKLIQAYTSNVLPQSNLQLSERNVQDFMLISRQVVTGSDEMQEILEQQKNLETANILSGNTYVPLKNNPEAFSTFIKNSKGIKAMATQGGDGVFVTIIDDANEQIIREITDENEEGGRNQESTNIKMVYMYLPQSILDELTRGSREGQRQEPVQLPEENENLFEQFEQRSNGKKTTSGKGLGMKDILNNDEINTPEQHRTDNYNISGTLRLERPFFFNYNLYEAYYQQNDEVFVFNRLLKEFFISCKSLTGHVDFLGKLFVDQLGEHRGTMNMYNSVHGRETTLTQVRQSKSLMSQSQLDYETQFPINAQGNFTDMIVQGAIKYNELVNDVLYDGYHEIKDQFTCMDIEIHNRSHLETPEKLQNLSVFTSSIYNFFGSWAKQQELTKQVPLDLMTQLNMKFNNEDLQIIVSNAIFTKFKLQGLIDKINFKQKILDHIAQQIFVNNTKRSWNIDHHRTMPLRQYLIAQSQFLVKIKNTIQHKIIFALDMVINNKHGVLPPILQQGSIGNVNQPLLSNLFFLIDNRKTLHQLYQGDIQDDDDVFKLNFAKYLYHTMNNKGSNTLLKELATENQYDVISRFSDLITFLAKHRFALYNTKLNSESYYAKAILLVPHDNLLKYNPEQLKNIKIPSDMQISQDGSSVRVRELLRLRNDINGLLNDYSIYITNLIGVCREWDQNNNDLAACAPAAAPAAGVPLNRAQLQNNARRTRLQNNLDARATEFVTVWGQIYSKLADLDRVFAIPINSLAQGNNLLLILNTLYGHLRPAGLVRMPANPPAANPIPFYIDPNNHPWADPNHPLIQQFRRDFQVPESGLDNTLNQACRTYYLYLMQNRKHIVNIGYQIYCYRLDVLEEQFVHQGLGDMYLQYRHFFTSPRIQYTTPPQAYVRLPNNIRNQSQPLLDMTYGNDDFRFAYRDVVPRNVPANKYPIHYYIRELNRMCPGLQIFPYVYCRREVYRENNTRQTQLINWTDMGLIFGNNEYRNHVYTQLAGYSHLGWVNNPGNAPKERIAWQPEVDPLNILEVRNEEDYLSLSLPIRITNARKLVYQSNPFNIVDYQPFSLQYCLPAINHGIFEEIVKYLSDSETDNTIETRNLIELGILPLNLQMLKRDSGLINISLYASAFQEYINKKFTQQDMVNIQNNRLPYHTPLFDMIKMDMGLKDSLIQRGHAPAMRGQNWPAQLDILEHIIRNTSILGLNNANPNLLIPNPVPAVNMPHPFPLMMKFDQMRQSLQFRVALFLYLILVDMLGGVVKDSRDVQLKGIEALISAQLMNPASQSENRKY